MAFDLRDYVDVAERLREFYEKHPKGRVITQLIDHSDKRVVVKAEVYREAGEAWPAGVGHSQMAIPGSTSYTRGAELENAETSAVGRALVMAGLPSKRIASSDEVAAKRDPGSAPEPKAPAPIQEPDLSKLAEDIFRDDAVVIPADSPLASAMAFAQATADGECPSHRRPWTLKPGGVSKTSGKPYDPFYTCSEKTESGWCKEKPKASWVAAQRGGR